MRLADAGVFQDDAGYLAQPEIRFHTALTEESEASIMITSDGESTFTALNRTYVLLRDYTIQAMVCQPETVLLASGHSLENHADAGGEGKGG